jgi:predicted glycosyltransferase/glycosyltransferase involved in cell wall biosynthesis
MGLPLTVLFHPTNHIGLGHINRLSAIALALRELNESVRTPFVVEGGGHELLDVFGLPYVPLPVSYAMEQTDCWKAWLPSERSSLIREVCRATMRSLDPQLAIFDCFPSHAVYLSVLEHGVPIVLCLRQMKDLAHYLDVMRDILPQVTSILIPHEEGAFELPKTLRDKSHFVGQIVRAHSQPIARPISGNRKILISGGGGGFPETARFYNLAMAAVVELRKADRSLECCLITGPLFRDWLALELPTGFNVIPFEPDMFAALSAADLVICQAGYNTVAELEQAGTKAIVVPAVRDFDDQFARARIIAARNPQISVFEGSDLLKLSQIATQLLREPIRRRSSTRPEGAQKAAEYLQKLLIDGASNTEINGLPVSGLLDRPMTSKETPRPLICATLIVRDEENFLGGCLASIRDLVDEIVVVDTGSSDRTRQIALSYGVKVFDYAWSDDFSAARNFALDQTHSEWILYIDADERIRSYDRSALERELSDQSLAACTVQFHQRTGFTAYPEYRLFRREDRIRFEGVMHETILPSVMRMVAEDGRRIGSSLLTIDHLGYDGDQTHKLQRNLRLLQKELECDPARRYLWWHLGTVYRDLGRLADAEAAWRTGIEIAESKDEREAEDCLCYIELSKLLFNRKQDALPYIDRALAMQPDNWLLQWLKAKILVAEERYAEAIQIFEQLGSIDADALLAPVAYDKRIFGAAAIAEIGQCEFRMGRYAESAEWYRRAELLAPTSLEFRVKRQLAHARAGSAGDRSDKRPAAANR